MVSEGLPVTDAAALDQFCRWLREGLADRDRAEALDLQLWREAGGLGLFGIAIPAEEGGRGGTLLELSDVFEKLGAVDLSFAISMLASYVVAQMLLALGTPSQRKRFLPSLASGESIGCLALSEPTAGSDLNRLKSRVEWGHEGGSLYGVKTHVTLAREANVLAVAARDVDPGTQAGGRTRPLDLSHSPISMYVTDNPGDAQYRKLIPVGTQIGRAHV